MRWPTQKLFTTRYSNESSRALIALACREWEIPALVSFDADFDQLPWLKRLATPDDLSL